MQQKFSSEQKDVDALKRQSETCIRSANKAPAFRSVGGAHPSFRPSGQLAEVANRHENLFFVFWWSLVKAQPDEV